LRTPIRAINHEGHPQHIFFKNTFALTAYHGDELHGGARWMGERILDVELVPVAREAILVADDLPADHEVLQALDHEPMHCRNRRNARVRTDGASAGPARGRQYRTLDPLSGRASREDAASAFPSTAAASYMQVSPGSDGA
jgi:hypothetical protein